MISRVRAWIVAGAAAIPVAAAAQSYELAVSRAHQAHVMADGTPWCGADLHLRLHYDSGSPDMSNPAAWPKLLSQLRAPIQARCGEARTATATVEADGMTPINFQATAAGGWQFTKAQQKSAALPIPPAKLAPSQQPAQSPATSPAEAPQAPYAPPLVLGYPSLVVALVKQSPTAANDPGVIRYWAQYRYEQQFYRVRNQEFKLQPLLERAQQDLSTTVAASPSNIVVIPVGSEFGEYDFRRHAFPIHVGGEQLQINMQPCCEQSDVLPRNTNIIADGLAAIDALPMQAEAAESFTARRTRFNFTDRRITMIVTLALNGEKIPANQNYTNPLKAIVQSVDVIEGRNNETLIHHFPAAELTALRQTKAARDEQAAREGEAQRAAQQQAARRQQQEVEEAALKQQQEYARQQLFAEQSNLIEGLKNQPEAVRLDTFLDSGTYVTTSELDSDRGARASAVQAGQPVFVNMLVQSDGSGSTDVPATWPGHLKLTVPQGGKPLSSGTWYLVSGKFSVPVGEDLPPATLRAEKIYACSQAQCADAADPAAIVKHKLAAAGGGSPNPRSRQ